VKAFRVIPVMAKIPAFYSRKNRFLFLYSEGLLPFEPTMTSVNMPKSLVCWGEYAYSTEWRRPIFTAHRV